MTNKTWNIEVAGQQHVIEVKSGSFAGGGSLTVDGKVASKWGTSISGLPMPLSSKCKERKRKSKARALWLILRRCISKEKR